MGSMDNQTIEGRGVSRRLVLGSSAALGAGLAASAVHPALAESVPGTGKGDHPGPPECGPSTRAAVLFLRGVTDAYRSSGPRLAQSYYDGSGLTDIGFVYDNALTIIGLLIGGDVPHARAIGDALVFAQQHDPEFHDGRLRQAYHANTFVNADGSAHFGYEYGLVGTAVGDMAWSGIALAQLAHCAGHRRYLDAALRIARWIVKYTYSTSGLGGYTFGETAGLQDHKSTEHNVDVYALFTMLARLTRNHRWQTRANHAWAFAQQQWNAADGFFWTGSDDGATINKNPLQLPADVQSWSWLAGRQRRYAAALDWAEANLASTDTPLRQNSALTDNQKVTGAVFASGSLLTDPAKPIGGQTYTPKPDPAAVWFEGTGQLALALKDRAAPRHDRDRHDPRAAALLGALGWAQHTLGAGQTFGTKRIAGGIVAASSNLDTGFGFGYYQHLHTAATAWTVMAATGRNPYRRLR